MIRSTGVIRGGHDSDPLGNIYGSDDTVDRVGDVPETVGRAIADGAQEVGGFLEAAGMAAISSGFPPGMIAGDGLLASGRMLAAIGRFGRPASKAAAVAEEAVEARSVAADTAPSVTDAARLKTQLRAEQIAKGHAWEKHVLGNGGPRGREYDDLGFSTPEQFADHVEGVMNNPTSAGRLSNGRSYSFDEETGTLVIEDLKHIDGGRHFGLRIQ